MPSHNQTSVLAAHQASYSDPLVVKRGEHLTVTDRQEHWGGHLWIWAIAADGRAGWIPDDLAIQSNDGWQACRNYSAVELSCAPGETVTVIETSHGWAWCTNTNGEHGWIPQNCLPS